MRQNTQGNMEPSEPADGDDLWREVRLPHQAWAMIDQLLSTGLYGDDTSEAIMSLIREPLMSGALKGFCTLPQPRR